MDIERANSNFLLAVLYRKLLAEHWRAYDDNSQPEHNLWASMWTKVREFPIFSILGAEFLDEMDSLALAFRKTSGRNYLAATKIDLEALMGHHVSMLALAKKEEWHDKASGHQVQSFWMHRLCIDPPPQGCFSSDFPKLKASKIHALRLRKAIRLQTALRRLLNAIVVCKNYMQVHQPGNKTPWWVYFAEGNFESLPLELAEFVHSAISLIAHIWDNVFVVLMWIDPYYQTNNRSPFVAEALRLLLWSPSRSIHSMMQKFAAMICCYDETLQEYNRYSARVSGDFKLKCQQIIKDCTTESTHTKNELLALLKLHGNTHIGADQIEFLRLSFRLASKSAFIEGLGEKTQLDFINHICKSIPQILRELGKLIDLSLIMSAFFKAIQTSMDAVNQYDPIQRNGHMEYVSDLRNTEIIKLISDALFQFVMALYPALAKMGEMHGSACAGAPVLWIKIIDYILEMVFTTGLSDQEFTDNVTGLGAKVNMTDLVGFLSEPDQIEVHKELESLKRDAKMGTHLDLWTSVPVIHEKLFPVFEKMVLGISGSNTQDKLSPLFEKMALEQPQ